jgi:hypothetical protein
VGLHRVPAQRKGVSNLVVAATLAHVVYDLFFSERDGTDSSRLGQAPESWRKAMTVLLSTQI